MTAARSTSPRLRIRPRSVGDSATLIPALRSRSAWGLLTATSCAAVLLGTIENVYPSTVSGSGAVAYETIFAVLVGARLTWTVFARDFLFSTAAFYLFTFIFMVLAPLASVLSGQNPLNYPFDNEQYVSIIPVIGIGILGYEVGQALAHPGKVHSSPTGQSVLVIRERGLRVATIVGLLSLAYALRATNAASVLFTSRTSFSAAVFGEGSSKATGAIYNAIILAVPFCLNLGWILRARTRAQKTIAGSITGWTITGIDLAVNNPIAQSRFWIATVYLSLLGAVAVGRWKGFGKFVIFVSTPGLILVFPFADVFRYSGASAGTSGNGFDQLSGKGDFDAATQLVAAHQYVSEFGLRHGQQVVGALFFFVPRSIWPSKAQDTGSMLGTAFGARNTNLSAPLWAEGYVDFGVLGTFIFLLILGFVARRLNSAGVGPTAGAISIFLGIYQFVLLRGSLLQAMGLTVVVAIILLTLIERRRFLPDNPLPDRPLLRSSFVEGDRMRDAAITETDPPRDRTTLSDGFARALLPANTDYQVEHSGGAGGPSLNVTPTRPGGNQSQILVAGGLQAAAALAYAATFVLAARSLGASGLGQVAIAISLGLVLADVLDFGQSTYLVRVLASRSSAGHATEADLIRQKFISFPIQLLVLFCVLKVGGLADFQVSIAVAVDSFAFGLIQVASSKWKARLHLVSVARFQLEGRIVAALTAGVALQILREPYTVAGAVAVGDLFTALRLGIKFPGTRRLESNTSYLQSLKRSFGLGVNGVSSDLANLDTFSVGIGASTHTAGLYATASRLLAPILTVGQQLGTYIYVQSASHGLTATGRTIRRLCGTAGLLLASGSVIFVFAGRQLVRLVFGAQFDTSYLACSFALLTGGTLIAASAYGYAVQGRNVADNAIGFIAAVSGVLALVLLAGGAHYYGVTGAGAGLFISSVLRLVLTYLMFRRVRQHGE